MDTAPALPLQRYQVFHSRDVDETRDCVARIFCPHRLSTPQPRRALDACHHSAPLHRGVSLNYVQYGPSVDIEPGYLRDFFLLQIPLRGGAQVQCGAQQVDADTRTASLLSPTEPVRMRWADDSPHLIVKVMLSTVLGQLESLAQAPVRRALVFDLGVPMADPALAPLLNFIHYLLATLDTGDALRGGALAEHAEAYLVSNLLMSASHNHSTELLGSARRALLPRSVRRAQEFLNSCPEQPLCLADLCRQVGVSARTLQLAFRQHVGQSPMEYLRDVRLDRVRDELRSASPERGVQVASVAARYGFVHLGHFAAQYRVRFGEVPSETLRGQGRH
jgi:AraC-like DNA-binding protein